VPRSYLGLSIEWDSVLPYTGPPGGRRGALPTLLAPVAGAAGAPLRLRIGGDTADQMWWTPGRRPRPRGVLQDVGPATADAIAWLARGLHAPVTLGVNLALGDPGNAVALARAVAQRLPPDGLAAVEIGNEPDLYTHAHTFRRGGHLHRRLRKRAHYGPDDYRRDVDRFLPRLRSALGPGPRLVVGGLAGPGWWPALPGLLRHWRGLADVVAGHLYAVPNCAASTPPATWLMSTEASRGRAQWLSPLIRIARSARLPLEIDELNSAACGGRPGLSDTRAGALWLTDTLFALLAEGAAAADVHTWHGASYAPFAVTAAGDVLPRPPLDGMLTFAHGAPAGSRLVHVAVRGGTSLRVWATVDATRTARITLLAPERAAAHIRAGAAAGARCASLWRAGGKATKSLCPTRGRYVVTLPARSLAVITVPPAGPAPS
jgi:hypothetical protein